MISSDSMRGYNDAIILAVLARGDSYGFEISKAITAGTNDAYTLRETTLYSTLTRLVKSGALSAYAGELSYGRPRTYYHLTGIGRTILAAKKQEWHQVQVVVTHFLEE